MKNVIVIIQARMGSKRLPGKVMKELHGKTVLEHIIERVKQAKKIDDIIIATTEDAIDDIIADEALKCGVGVFRGSENDVLSRYYHAARKNCADIIVRITSDCPLIDPYIIDEMVEVFKSRSYDIVSNGGSDLTKRTYPRGLDVEIFTFDALQNAYKNANEKYQKEHVTPYIYRYARECFYYKCNKDYSRYRWTLDTKEDWLLLQKIYEKLYHGKHNFYFTEILFLMETNLELLEINSCVEQKELEAGDC